MTHEQKQLVQILRNAVDQVLQIAKHHNIPADVFVKSRMIEGDDWDTWTSEGIDIKLWFPCELKNTETSTSLTLPATD